MLQIPISSPTHAPAPPIDFNAWATALGTDEWELRGAVRVHGYQKTALMMGPPPLEALRAPRVSTTTAVADAIAA